LDLVASIDGRPFNSSAAVRIAAALLNLTDPYCDFHPRLIELLEADTHWQYQTYRVLNWLCFKDAGVELVPNCNA